MKVFYVVVLVLVARAVPTHERTESEGTVFNKIQRHESMSNVAVSSSKLVTYGFSYLAMQWPRSFCNNRPCSQSVPARFTVHGLWPQYNLTHSIDCGRINRRYGHFKIQLPNFRREFLDDLKFYWPDLTKVKDYNHFFWGNEYDKHGSCTFNDQIGYFRLTLELARNFENLISRLTGIGGITFGRLYSSDEIKGAVYRVTNKWPTLKCVRAGDLFLLLEIRFCVGRYGLIDCFPYTDCMNRMVYLPQP